MPRAALIGYLAFVVLAFGVRAVIQRRRTGSTGFVPLSAVAGPWERAGAALFALAVVAAGAAPVLALTGLGRPLADAWLAHAAGAVLGLVGIALTLRAQLDMGDSWRVGVDPGARTALVTGGLFRRMRNPIFTGMLLAAAGLVLLVPNAVAALALVALLVAVEIHVRFVEEPYLLRTHGDAYRVYASRTGRFLPGIGRLPIHPGDYVPALRLHVLTPLYDVAARLTGERRLKRRLLERAGIGPDTDVLDLGCGTGTLAVMAAARVPTARIVGLDVDPAILAIARRKVGRAGVRVALVEGSATEPPFPPASFDRVLTTLVLHHLTTPRKRAALAAARRVLRAGGELHVADFGRPHTALMRLAAAAFRWFDGDEATGANLRGELPALVREAGFVAVEESERWRTPFGTLTFLRALASAVPAASDLPTAGHPMPAPGSP
jgi:protein-S-isoprenylcysteine O-methyltransferase Ste14/SAM-dependent methyltransferase